MQVRQAVTPCADIRGRTHTPLLDTHCHRFFGAVPQTHLEYNVPCMPPFSPVFSRPRTVSACQFDPVNPADKLYYSLGKVASATWTEQADGVTVTYTGGSSDWESKPREVVVHMKCSVDGHNSFGPAYQDPDASTARYYINLTLADACGKAPPLPDPATCQEVLYEHPDARDGEFVLKCPESNVALSIWCHDMAGGSPKEYLSLPFENNYAEYLCGPQCKSRHPRRRQSPQRTPKSASTHAT